MKHLFFLVFSLSTLLPHISLATDHQNERLSGDQIKQLCANNTAVCIKEKDRSSCLTYMSTDGSVKRLTHSNNKVRKGTWRIGENDRLCIQWAGKKKELCFDITQMPNMTYQLHRKGKLKSTIIAVMPGDKIGDFSGL